MRNDAEYNRQWRIKNPFRYLLNQARYRARKAGEVCDVTVDDLEVPTHCPVFGIPLHYTEGGRTANSYSIDRVDNSKGYVKGNVRVISFRANQMKGDLTIPEVEALLNYMKGI